MYVAGTVPSEPGRRPIARGRDEASEEDVYRQHPQLAQLLRTEFNSLVVGHSNGDVVYHYLPPMPPRIHAFVYLCDREQAQRFSQSLDFLNLLVKAPQSGDEVVAASLRFLASFNEDNRGFLVSAGRELSRLLAGEPQRLNAILRRMRP